MQLAEEMQYREQYHCTYRHTNAAPHCIELALIQLSTHTVHGLREREHWLLVVGHGSIALVVFVS